MSAGDGAKGPRVYHWALVEVRPIREAGQGYWLLAQRSVAKPEELAYYVCYGPADTTLGELVRVAGTRWAIAECFEEAKGIEAILSGNARIAGVQYEQPFSARGKKLYCWVFPDRPKAITSSNSLEA